MTAAPYQVMPPLSADEREALKADIAERGVMVPVEYDEAGHILDGHHRVEICGELSITHWPRLVRHGLSEAEKRRHARRLNLDRRHLDAAARRKLIEDDLREAPEASDRKIAVGLGVHHNTVGSVRATLESTGEISQLDARKGRDQRTRKIVQYVDPSPEGVRGSKLTAKAIFKAERDAGGEARTNLQRALSDESAKLEAGRRMPVIYADPATRFLAGLGPKSTENHYKTMTTAELCALAVGSRALPDCELYIWSTVPQLVNTIAIANAWGFPDYSSHIVWDKTSEDHPREMGPGYVFRNQHELLLRFTRGNPPGPKVKPLSIYRERKREHSRKPDWFRQMIIEMTGNLPVVELFARVDSEHLLPDGWESWGNQAAPAEAPDQLVDVNSVIGPVCDEPFNPETGEIGDAQRPSNRDLSAGDEPSSGVGPQAEAPLAGTGSETLAGHEGHSPKGAEPSIAGVVDRDDNSAPASGRIVEVRLYAPVDPPSARIITEGEPDPDAMRECIETIVAKYPHIPLESITHVRIEDTYSDPVEGPETTAGVGEASAAAPTPVRDDVYDDGYPVMPALLRRDG